MVVAGSSREENARQRRRSFAVAFPIAEPRLGMQAWKQRLAPMRLDSFESLSEWSGRHGEAQRRPIGNDPTITRFGGCPGQGKREGGALETPTPGAGWEYGRLT